MAYKNLAWPKMIEQSNCHKKGIIKNEGDNVMSVRKARLFSPTEFI